MSRKDNFSIYCNFFVLQSLSSSLITFHISLEWKLVINGELRTGCQTNEESRFPVYFPEFSMISIPSFSIDP